AGLALLADGEPTNRITLSAAPGHEGTVIIDGQGTRVPILIRGDYVTVKNLEIRACFHICIYSPSNGNDSTIGADPTRFTLEPALVNLYVHHVDDDTPLPATISNVALIRLDWAKDPLLRNNELHTVTIRGVLTSSQTAAYECYACWGGMFENTEVYDTGSAFLFKTHVFDTQGATVRYNLVHTVGSGINVITGGRPQPTTGQRFTNNIFYDISGAGITYNMNNNVDDLSQGLILNNNLFYGPDDKGISIAGWVEVEEITGNIFIGLSRPISNTWYGPAFLLASDYNVFAPTMSTVLKTYGGETVDYATFEQNSVITTADLLFTDAANHDFSHLAGSPALNLLGTEHAGPYATGVETIGLLPGRFPAVR
ncbi:MAG: right-handed parallel beta-helix repeat-containing protein, partial [Actinomycetia bacterium]|nr:right-handed parallel beta-helix repeat-containing protein [Actinomycetes bacterium]